MSLPLVSLFTRVVFSLCLLQSFGNCLYDSNTIPEKIYQQVPVVPCTRLLNDELAVGCSSPLRGTSGSLYHLSSVFDIQDFLSNLPVEKKTIVMEAALFSRSNVESIYDSDQVNAFVILDAPSDAPAHISHAPKFPNQKFSLHKDSTFAWNPNGDAMLDAYIRYPMVWVSEANSNIIREKAKFNNLNPSSPQWEMSFDYFMDASEDAETCLNYNLCQPVGGQSVWGSLGPWNETKPIIFVTTEIDSNSIFRDRTPAAQSAMAGTVATMTALKHLTLLDPETFDRALIFGMFNSEAFGFAGSSRFVRDIVHFECDDYDDDEGHCYRPWVLNNAFKDVDFKKIDAVIGVGELGNAARNNSKPVAYVHREHDSNPATDNLVAELTSLPPSTTSTWEGLQFLSASTETPGVPPNPVVSFIKANSSIPVVVLSDHHREFSNLNYHSAFDTTNTVDIESVCQFSEQLMRSLWGLLHFNSSISIPSDPPFNCTDIEPLLKCLVNDLKCDESKGFWDYGRGAHPHYPGVYGNDDVSEPVYFIYEWMRNATSPAQNSSFVPCTKSEDCESGFSCVYGSCRKPYTQMHPALTPALNFHRATLWTGAYWMVESYGGKFPLWAESNWASNVGILLYQKSGTTTDIMVAIIGLFGVVVSCLTTILLKKHFVGYFFFPPKIHDHDM